MPTTALLVEIVIVGFIFFISMIPIVSTLFNFSPTEILGIYNSVPIHLQLALAYPFGVIWNRICDQVFSRLDEIIISLKFKNKTDFQFARIEVVMYGESIRDYIGNFRSLIRIARAVSFSFFIYIFFTPLYFYTHQEKFTGFINLTLIVVLEFILFSSSMFSWYKLERGYVSAIRDALSIVKKHKNDLEE